MSKRNRAEGPYQPRGDAPGGSDGTFRFAVLGGIALLVVMSAWSAVQVRGVNTRVAELDTKIADLQKKVDAAPKAAQQAPSRGPDPNKVYTVKSEGAPIKGNLSAPVTIAEFSDFQ
jgi:protein-disulfide isomerase